MKHILLFFFLYTISVCSQHTVKATFIKDTTLTVQSLVEINNFGTQYHIQHNTFYKTENTKSTNYSNVQLGEITSANAFNPLKLNLFYSDFNTVIVLDNRLSEIFKIDFNTTKPYKSVSHISTGNDNTIWIFNQDTQQLELYDYKTNTVRAKTLPIQSRLLDIKSNFNYCWLLTENYLYKYSYFGSTVSKIENKGFTALEEDNGNLILQKENSLFYHKKNTNDFQKLEIPNLLISQFLLTNETLYIYHSKILSKFQLKTE